MKIFKHYPTCEFHVSRKARDLYQFDETLFSKTGNVIFANFLASRQFTNQINAKKDLLNYPEQAVRASDINAMGLIDEIMHMLVNLYRQQKNPLVFRLAMEYLEARLGREDVDQILTTFIDEFPPLAVYKNETSIQEYLQGESEGLPHRQIALEELVMLWLANVNPAFSPYGELFDDTRLEKETRYKELIDSLYEFFDSQPGFGPGEESLIELLRSAAKAHPHSLFEQLEYIRKRWGTMLGSYLYRLLGSLDFLKEETKPTFIGPGPSSVYEYKGLEVEEERFSHDADWMPRVVMLAKNAYVWLDQLSRKYGRSIDRLDQVPDKELDDLAAWGFTSLWLIGLWERSKASKRIKQMCGNSDAEASAYSLYDYQISADLGGQEAFGQLRDRAWQRGIRMAGDMVPNHVGIDGKWVMEHPDWFVSLGHSPYPSYTFNGPNLSQDDRIGIYLEDHYYSRSDAAVVFKRVDQHSGDTKYIYHGNDGTSMPWNDTAQLNFLNPETREAVIQTILHVARNFPVIRFDAAMTLAKKHIQRLWFPEPGTGGAIPSRAEHGLTKEQFNQAIPVEFWREVVDRVAQEAPDTLLLAEAFWLLEGYFVRTLGMHRVYNSAFMNMLKKEDNASYRNVIKNTIQFDPEILKRFVNFMNNPDEETAVAQFGKDDKYFGVCILLSTMPGLPMFGHGQIEGFTEKYGMEFRRAYWDERPDPHLIERHKHQIFPLLRKRYLFSDVTHFLLYDVMAPEGFVNEDIFAYSNKFREEKALVVYNNRFSDAKGFIKTSVGFAARTGKGDERVMTQKTLAEGLELRNEDHGFTIFSDHITGQEFIRSNRQLIDQGLFVDMGAFKYHVFLDFRQVEHSSSQPYRDLFYYLDGRGVPSIEEAMREIFLQPIITAMKGLGDNEFISELLGSRLSKPTQKLDSKQLDKLEKRCQAFIETLDDFQSLDFEENNLAKEVRYSMEIALQIPVIQDRIALLKRKEYLKSLQSIQTFFQDHPERWFILYHWLVVRNLGKLTQKQEFSEQSRCWIDELFLGKKIRSSLLDIGMQEYEANNALLTVKVLTGHQFWYESKKKTNIPYTLLRDLLQDRQVQQLLNIHRYQEQLYYRQESFEELIGWLLVAGFMNIVSNTDLTSAELSERLLKQFRLIQVFRKAEKESEFRVELLLDALKE
jgi:glycosidase